MAEIPMREEATIPNPGIGDLVEFTTDFPGMEVWEGDRGTIAGVAQWGEWRILVSDAGDIVRMKTFTESSFKIVASAARAR